jgi:hypothetical protein
MGAAEEILKNLDINQLANMLGVDADSATAAVTAAIPTLLSSMQANSDDEDGEAALETAVAKHADTGADGSDLSAINIEDGRKIVKHAIADDPQRLAALSGIDKDLVAKLLPILAPIVMNYLAKKFLNTDSGSTTPIGELIGGLLESSSSSGLGDLLGGLLGGGSTKDADDSGIDLGDLLGRILAH